MAQRPDKNWLLTQQYHDSSRLGARANLHARFATNPYRWFPWIFDHFQLPENARILELGCGPGWLWLSNRDRIPADWDITLTDFSSGMLDEARRNVEHMSHTFNYSVADAQEIPYPDNSYDGVIANHMLYHMPDIPTAISEIRRVLKDGGRLYASTLSSEYLHELAQFLPSREPAHLRFNLENGADILAEQFERVTLHRYANTLVITEAEPLIAYIVSMTPASATEMHERIRAGIGQRLREYLASHGELRLTADAGLFEAW